MKNIEVGDVVTLKSGSPKMTVYAVDGGYTKSMHFDSGTNKIVLLDLPVSALKLADEPVATIQLTKNGKIITDALFDMGDENDAVDALYKLICGSCIRWDLGEVTQEDFNEYIKGYFEVIVKPH